MAIKLEVIIPTTRALTETEQEEIIWAVHDAIRTKIASGELDHLNLANRPIVNHK
jgi:hypothetical protein